jgi:hypothetical protein
VVVVTEELARTPLVGGTQLIENALRGATASITDAAFITTLTAGLSPVTSVGTTADAVRQTIATLLGQVTLGQGSAPFLITTPAICKAWCMLADNGVSAFPELGPMGGVINKIPVIASDGVLSGQVILVDASGIAAAPGEVALQDFHETTSSATAQFSGCCISYGHVAVATNLAAIMVEDFLLRQITFDAVALPAVVSNSPA